MKLVLSSRVGANSCSAKVVASAGPSVSSSMAARKPPWTCPIGFVNSRVASNRTRILPLPGSASSTFQPSSFAAGGGGISPRAAAQNGLSPSAMCPSRLASSLGLVQRHGGADEGLQRRLVDLLSLAEVDGTPRVPLEAGVEQARRILQRRAFGEGHL